MMIVSAKLYIACCMNLNSQFKMLRMFVYCHILIYSFEGSYAIKNIFFFFLKSNSTIYYLDLFRD